MGMPRFLKNRYKELYKCKEENFEFFIYLGMRINDLVHNGYESFNITRGGKFAKKYDFLNQESPCEYSMETALRVLGKKAFKMLHGYEERPFDKDENERDRFKCTCHKLKIKWFLYYEKEEEKWTWVYKELEVPYHLYEKAKILSEKKREKEWQIIEKKEEIDRIRNIEQGRIFTGRLRQMILERDNFKCVYCGKGVEDNIKLEIDHIKAWEDGGKTVYDNGQTLCSDCNKGKHHIKKYNNKIKELENLLTN